MASHGSRFRLCLFALAAILVILDLYSKSLAVDYLEYGVPRVITGFFNLTLLHNTGAAFSFLSDAGGWQRWFFVAISIVVSAAVGIWITRIAPQSRLLGVALALVLGGALGNLWDRITLGYVVDFIQVHYRDYYWPAFNVADSAITVGAVLLLFDSLFLEKSRGARQEEPEDA